VRFYLVPTNISTQTYHAIYYGSDHSVTSVQGWQVCV